MNKVVSNTITHKLAVKLVTPLKPPIKESQSGLTVSHQTWKRIREMQLFMTRGVRGVFEGNHMIF